MTETRAMRRLVATTLTALALGLSGLLAAGVASADDIPSRVRA
jgi:hypothetical protein